MAAGSIFNSIATFPPGTTIPKPGARAQFKIKGLGERRGERAIIYLIPNHTDPSRPYQKGVTASEIERAHAQLLLSGRFTRAWFNSELKNAAREGACNFTTIGGLFELMGIATYVGDGVYLAATRGNGRE